MLICLAVLLSPMIISWLIKCSTRASTDSLLKIIPEKVVMSGSSKFVSYIYMPSTFHKAIFYTIPFALSIEFKLPKELF